MSVDLSDYTDVLRREVTPPGSTLFATVADDTFTGTLADAFWEAVLDNLITGYTCTADGIITPINTGDPEFPRQQIALVVLYGGLKILRNQLVNTKTRLTAKAGPVEYTAETGSNVITSMLKQLEAVRDRLLYLSQFGNSQVYLIDALSVRQASTSSYSGYLYDVYLSAFGAPPEDRFNLSPFI
jgi:hypothetical protein